jgi:aldehyde dehydrogenase (NAD+)
MMDDIVSYEPAAPERIVGTVSSIADDELEVAIAAGKRSLADWSVDAASRVDALHAWADRIAAESAPLAELVAREVGKPIREANAEVARTIGILRYYAQASYDAIGELFPGADRTTETVVRRVRVGLVAAICPWNFPLAIPTWKLAPALAYGNTVILKPASAAVVTAERLVELARPGVPEDVLIFAPMPGGRVDRLLNDPRIDAVSFTGSAAVGRDVIRIAAGRGAAVQAEMGGQNPSVVLADADLDHAASTIAGAAMGYAGQKCTATSRILVEDSVARDFRDKLIDVIGGLRVGDPLDPNTAVGPVIDEAALQTVESAVDAAIARGASPLVTGRSGDHGGWYYPPTVLNVADSRDPFMQEETFGPVAALRVVDSAEEAVRIANETSYGLSAAVFGSDSSRTRRVAQSLQAGMIRINGPTTGADFWAPFGGERGSSYGPHEQGRAAREFYTRTRTITVVAI